MPHSLNHGTTESSSLVGWQCSGRHLWYDRWLWHISHPWQQQLTSGIITSDKWHCHTWYHTWSWLVGWWTLYYIFVWLLWLFREWCQSSRLICIAHHSLHSEAFYWKLSYWTVFSYLRSRFHYIAPVPNYIHSRVGLFQGLTSARFSFTCGGNEDTL